MSLHGEIDERASKGRDKIAKVIGEFKRGTLRHGMTGKPVSNRKTALAIAFNEARNRGLKV